jgi:glutamate decarboxylase
MRLLIRHGFSRDMADLLLADFRREIAHLQKHKPSKPLDASEATRFAHDAVPREKLPAAAR